MKIISQKEIPALVTELSKKGARPFTVCVSSEKKLLVKNRQTKQSHEMGKVCRKISIYNCFLNFDYENSVNRQLAREEKETDFEAQSNWFQHTATRAIVASKNDPTKLYLQLKIERILSTKFVLESGEEKSKEELKDYLPIGAPAKNQGTDKAVLTICPALSSIISFTCEGETFQVADFKEVKKILAVKAKKSLE